MITPDGLLLRLSHTDLAVAIQQSGWLFPTIETVHVIALTLVVGSISVLDLRLLQVVSRDRAVTELTAEVLPWTWTSFLVAMISGSLMFSSKAPIYAANWPFRVKLMLMACAGINMLLFHVVTYRTVHHWNTAPHTPLAAKIAGTLSLLFWIGVVACGRWIGFTT